MTRHPDCESQPSVSTIDRDICRERVRRQCGECLACEVGQQVQEQEQPHRVETWGCR